MSTALFCVRRIAAAGLLVLPPLAAGLLNAHAADGVMSAFGGPAARLAAFMLGAPCTAGDGAVQLHMGALVVDVTARCGGMGFFAILWSFLYFLSLREPGRFPRALRRTLQGWVLLGICAYPIALFANACRLCLSVFVFKGLHPLWDGRIDALAHEAAGVTVFLFFLIAIAFFFRHIRHDNATPAA